jgi:hypothetical protein
VSYPHGQKGVARTTLTARSVVASTCSNAADTEVLMCADAIHCPAGSVQSKVRLPKTGLPPKGEVELQVLAGGVWNKSYSRHSSPARGRSMGDRLSSPEASSVTAHWDPRSFGGFSGRRRGTGTYEG